jgi:hypothetical protein
VTTPCRAYRAKTKGKVERPFRYVREDFFLGGRFQNLDDLNAQFRQWQDDVANARVHSTTRRVVAEHFAEERPHLLALPAGTFQAVRRLERRITRDGMVSVGGNLYGVPNDSPAAGGGATTHHRRRGAHPGRRAGDRGPSGAGGPRPAPHHRRASQPASALRAGETVAPRPLAFYGAVARRLAAAGPQP